MYYYSESFMHINVMCDTIIIFISTGPISSKLFHAIQKVETGGVADPENAVGDGGKAIGPYQIHDVYWQDAKSYDSSLVANGETYQNCRGSGSFNYSERVMQVINFYSGDWTRWGQ